MISLNDKVPDYLFGKHQLISTVTFAALFSLVFLMVSIPFSDNAWFKLDTTRAFSYTIRFFVIALLMVCISKRLMYMLRYSHNWKFGEYVLWNIIEILAVCGCYTYLTYYASDQGVITLTETDPDKIFFNSITYCVISLGVPYIIAGMYFAINEKDNTIRLMNYGNVVTDEMYSAQDEKKITIFDNNGVLKLSIKSSNLYYIESNDNFIKVWYTDSGGILKQYMLRCRLKTIEDSFKESELVRCHRKYIVNMNHIKMLTKEKDGYVIELDGVESEPIPISKTYEENVLSRFNSR